MTDTLERVLAEARPIAERFVAAGYTIHLVGGIVRDLHLGASISDLDFDLTTDAQPSVIKEIVTPVAEAVWTQGERFGTIGFTVKGRPFEVTTNRAESYLPESRKPEVRFGTDIVEDLSRRDFTVNAMAIELPDGSLIDPFDGRADLAAGRLVTPIDPADSFADDPLRILRASRFIARYGLEPTDEVLAAARDLAPRLEIVSVERIRDEVDKLFAAQRPSLGLRFLDEVNALQRMFVDLGEVDVDDLGDQLDEADPEGLVRRIVMMSAVAPDRRESQLSALCYSNAESGVMRPVLQGLELLANHGAGEWSDEDLRRLVVLVGYGNIGTLFAAGEATGLKVDVASMQFEALDAIEDLRDVRPAVSGGDIIEALDIDPGPLVGQAMAALTERRIASGPIDPGEEIDWLRAEGFG